MRKLLSLSAFAGALLLLGSSIPASAADTAQFGGTVNAAAAYPNLPLAVSLVVAGGGPTKYSTGTLVGTLAGDKAAAEVQSLTQKFGKDKVTSFVTVFDFVIGEYLVYASANKVALPPPSPDPKDGKALAGALFNAGNDKGNFNVEYMLDTLVTHPVHVQVMKDIDAKYGRDADANYHIVLTQAMTDLASVYGLK